MLEEHWEPLLEECIDGDELLELRWIGRRTVGHELQATLRELRARRVGSITQSTVRLIIPALLRYRAWRSPRREIRSTQPACMSRRVMLLTVPRLVPNAVAI